MTLVNIGVGGVKRMKVKTGGSRILSHWEDPEKGIPKERDEEKRREFGECEGSVCDLDSIL